jgi:drug/metabolite transporter (DMT)-like permease
MLRWLKLAAVLTLWALSFVLNEVALESAEAMTVVAGRWTVTAVLALALLARRGQVGRFGSAMRLDWRNFFVLSLVGVTLLYGLQVVGQTRTSAVNAGLLANMVPVFTALLAAAVLHKRPRAIGWLGIAVALVGAWLVSVGQQAAGGGQVEPSASSALGDLLVLASSLVAALYFIFGSRLLRAYPSLMVTAAAATLGAITLLPLALVFGGGTLSWQFAAAIVLLGVGPGLLANLWWWETIEWLDASRAAVYIYLIPLITMGFAVVILQEPLSSAQVLGAALVLGGVGLAERGQPP